MSQSKPSIATILRANGLSLTKQRNLVFDLVSDQEPKTMKELYALAHGQMDRASLYRIITVFERLGIIRRINTGWKHKFELSDQYTEHHHHLVCLKCHHITEINENELEGFISKLGNSYRFKPIEHQVEIQGYCESCVEPSESS